MRSEREHQRDSEHQSTDHRGASSLLCQTNRFAPYMPKRDGASLGKVGERPFWVSDAAACRPLAGWPFSARRNRRLAYQPMAQSAPFQSLRRTSLEVLVDGAPAPRACVGAIAETCRGGLSKHYSG